MLCNSTIQRLGSAQKPFITTASFLLTAREAREAQRRTATHSFAQMVVIKSPCETVNSHVSKVSSPCHTPSLCGPGLSPGTRRIFSDRRDGEMAWPPALVTMLLSDFGVLR
jgi:hypothetical protein